MSSGINHILGKPNDFFINLGDHAFFGENAYIKEVSFDYRLPDLPGGILRYNEVPQLEVLRRHPVEINICAVAPDVNLIFQATSKISLKQVKDCSIDELIYAVREKIRRGEL